MKKLIFVFIFLTSFSTCIGIYKFGFNDGIKINIAAMLCAFENRVSIDRIPDDVPIYEVKIKEKDWEKICNNLPKSKKEKIDVIFHHNGKDYNAKIKFRGHLKLHWGGKKKSIRVYFKENSPFGSINQMNFINPKTYQMTNNHIATWIGNKVQTNTLLDKLVFLKINGKNYGLMEMVEQPSKKYEINANLGTENVTLFKGDYLEDKNGKDSLVNLWASLKNWKIKNFNDEAVKKFDSLIYLLNRRDISLKDRFLKINKLVLIDEFLKFYATLTLANTQHIDQTHNQIIILSNLRNKFCPVLWDPTLMWSTPNNHFYNFYDPLSYYILKNPLWREQRDKLIYQFIINFYDSGKLINYHKNLENKLWSSVKIDYNKCNPIGENLNNVYRFSNSMYLNSNNKIRHIIKSYYDLIKTNINDSDIEEVKIDENTVKISYSTNVPIILEIKCKDKLECLNVKFLNKYGKVIKKQNEFLTIKLFGDIIHEDGLNGSYYKNFSGFKKISVSEEIYIEAAPLELKILNSITKDTIKKIYINELSENYR
jgi:hypothetical protein